MIIVKRMQMDIKQIPSHAAKSIGNSLPSSIVTSILRFVDKVTSVARAQGVCRAWNALNGPQQDAIWSNLYQREWGPDGSSEDCDITQDVHGLAPWKTRYRRRKAILTNFLRFINGSKNGVKLRSFPPSCVAVVGSYTVTPEHAFRNDRVIDPSVRTIEFTDGKSVFLSPSKCVVVTPASQIVDIIYELAPNGQDIIKRRGPGLKNVVRFDRFGDWLVLTVWVKEDAMHRDVHVWSISRETFVYAKPMTMIWNQTIAGIWPPRQRVCWTDTFCSVEIWDWVQQRALKVVGLDDTTRSYQCVAQHGSRILIEQKNLREPRAMISFGILDMDSDIPTIQRCPCKFPFTFLGNACFLSPHIVCFYTHSNEEWLLVVCDLDTGNMKTREIPHIATGSITWRSFICDKYRVGCQIESKILYDFAVFE
jgi:hypothetical protein